VFLDRDGEVFKYILHYLRARASASDAIYLPGDEVTRHALRCEARYFALPCLEGLLEAPNGSFADVYAQQSSALDAYIAAQPFQVGVCVSREGRGAGGRAFGCGWHTVCVCVCALLACGWRCALLPLHHTPHSPHARPAPTPDDQAAGV
jgi:hypothetical protein